ncbi:MAG: phosphomannomutase [Pseudomonadota bacterium]
MPPKFGTSGLRGLVVDLTDTLCADYAQAFLQGVETDGTVLIGRDLRDSSPRIAAAVATGAARAGLNAIDCGVLPTPALALAATTRGTAAIMVTGSHIPADRNGLKFYTRHGEITKDDETSIANGVAALATPAEGSAAMKKDTTALAAFTDRYTAYFAPDALAGLRIGVYEHSSAAQSCLAPILTALGAFAVPLGRSETFIPVDTEALDPDTQGMLAGWAEEHSLDAVVSTDGDADRPMLADAAGRVIPGDRLGPLTAKALGANTLVTPVSSNTLADLIPGMTVHRTKIGSPYVIAGMEAAMAGGAGDVVGYEANGGFLIGFTATRDGRSLAPLMTRDCILPILAPLSLACSQGLSIADLNATLPARFTAADRLVGVETDKSRTLIEALFADTATQTRLFAPYGPVTHVDDTDGFRATFADTLIIHLRPSGNAPECRVYVEAGAQTRADTVLADMLGRVQTALD